MFKRTKADDHYDCIVVGSGIGGLTTANLLAKVGKQRVLVLERHFKAGGFTHSFRRHDYEWDVGLHYVGQMQPGALSRRVMDLITGHQVQWQPMGSPYERFVYPDFTYEVPTGKQQYRKKLIDDFPDQRAAIDRYFRDLKAAESWGIRWFTARQSGSLMKRALTWPGKRLALRTTADYLEQHISNPRLRLILGSQWPDIGTPPRQSAFAFHALLCGSYLEGGFYPVGGAQRIGQSAVALLEQHGGRCLLNHEVAEILVQDGRVTGVRAVTRSGERHFYAPRVVTNIGVRNTFERLVPQEQCQVERQRLSRAELGPSAMVLFLGLNASPRTRNFDDANYWIFEDESQALGKTAIGDHYKPDGVFLSFGSLRDPMARSHTAQVIAFGREQDWIQFGNSVWKRRGAEYEARKQAIAEALLDFVEQRTPGLRALVDYAELSTPLTVKSFTGHAFGGIYGNLCVPSRLDSDAWSCATTLPGLYLSGADVGMPGISGAQMAGLMTAGKILGPLGLPRIMLALFRSPKVART